MKKNINKIISIVACASLVSCTATDAWLVKNTGLTSTDALLLGVKTKERIDLTLKEYNAVKNRNLPSGKEVVEVVVAEEPKEELEDGVIAKPSMVDSVLAIFGF
jgi:hypothetical protein